jgi:hypothetical protein
VSDVVPTDPRLPWVQPRWLSEASGWIRARLADEGLKLVGEIEQPHVRWWSTVMRAPTTAGDLWFKANAPPHAFEASLLEILEGVRPGCVPELVASDPARGWLLMRDGGTRLRDVVRSRRDLHHWQTLLPSYAELQLAVASRVDDLLATGVPDERLDVLPAHLEKLLEDREGLLGGQPGRLSEEERARAHALLPELGRTCARLAAFGIPETLQHDDLHDGNVFVRDGDYLFFDWGDSCVSHPFHTLVVTLRAVAHRLGLPPGSHDLLRLRDTYLERFSAYGSLDELRAAADLAHVTGTAGRTLAWRRFLVAREPEFRVDDAETVPYGVRRLLDLGPIGSWN